MNGNGKGNEGNKILSRRRGGILPNIPKMPMDTADMVSPRQYHNDIVLFGSPDLDTEKSKGIKVPKFQQVLQRADDKQESVDEIGKQRFPIRPNVPQKQVPPQIFESKIPYSGNNALKKQRFEDHFNRLHAAKQEVINAFQNQDNKPLSNLGELYRDAMPGFKLYNADKIIKTAEIKQTAAALRQRFNITQGGTNNDQKADANFFKQHFRQK